MNEQSKEDLLKFKKEQLVEIIIMCHKANKYYLSKIDKAIKYITSNEWAKDYELSSCRTHLLDILRGEGNE